MPDLGDYERAVWVSSAVSARGGYLITVHYTPDRSVSLDPIRALTYVSAAIGVAARAEYAAAVLKQLKGIGIDDKHAGPTIGELMHDGWEGAELAEGVRLVPLIAKRDRQAYIRLEVDGERITQWRPADARQHALQLLDVRACVDLDARYRHYLTDTIRLAEETAAALVGDLARYREDDSDVDA